MSPESVDAASDIPGGEDDKTPELPRQEDSELAISPEESGQEQGKRGRGRVFYSLALLGIIVVVFSLGSFLVLGGSGLSSMSIAPAQTESSQVVTSLPELTVAPGTEIPGLGHVILADDFSDENSGWWTGEVPDLGVIRYAHGAYEIEVQPPDGLMLSTMAVAEGDMDLTVTARMSEGFAKGNPVVGLMCRVQEDSGGYYFYVSPGGSYAIFKLSEGSWIPLSDWANSPAIRTGDQSNDLSIICQGETLSFIVNATPLTEVIDSEFSAGDIGLLAASYDEMPVVVRFDDLFLREPALGKP